MKTHAKNQKLHQASKAESPGASDVLQVPCSVRRLPLRDRNVVLVHGEEARGHHALWIGRKDSLMIKKKWERKDLKGTPASLYP